MFFVNCASFLKEKMYLCTKILDYFMNNVSLPSGVQLLELPEYVDERGLLCFLEEEKQIPFPIRRVFWITDVPATAVRGGHAHWTCHEAVFAVTGSFEIEVDDGVRRYSTVLDSPHRGITIPAGVWCELRHFEPGTVCVVMASHPYDASGYALDREAWEKELRNRKNE